MNSAKITAGLLAPTPESLEEIRRLADAAGSISIAVESNQNCAKASDPSTRQFTFASPEIILVDIEDPQAGILSLETLHAALPETRLYAISKTTNPQLIISAVRAGAREFFPKPVHQGSFSRAMERYIAEKQRVVETKNEGKVYCFTAAKEGSGVTTTAINVACTLAAAPGTRVALIDLDGPTGDASIYMNLIPQRNVEDALEAGSRLDNMLLENCVTPSQELSVIAAPKRELGTQKTANVEASGKLVKVAAQTFTHTVIDLPRTIPLDHLKEIAKASEALVVIMNPDLSSISRTGHLLRYLAGCELGDKIRLVVNRSHKSDEIAPAVIKNALHHAIFHRIPDNHEDSIKAMMAGIPVVRGRDSALARSYRELTYELSGVAGHKGHHRGSAKSGSWKRVFGAIFGRSGNSRGSTTGQPQHRGGAAPLQLNTRH